MASSVRKNMRWKNMSMSREKGKRKEHEYPIFPQAWDRLGA
jgi:hypothetical protein